MKDRIRISFEFENTFLYRLWMKLFIYDKVAFPASCKIKVEMID